MKKVVFFIVGFVLVAYIISISLFTVNAKEYAIITQFGKTVNIITKPGLYRKLPGFLQTVNRLDKRMSLFTTQPIQLLLGDKNPLIITCYVGWKIEKPLVFFQSLLSKDIAEQKLNDMTNSHLGSTLSNYKIENIINMDEKALKLGEIEKKIRQAVNESAQEKYGISIVSVGLRRINYPQIVARSVYSRMRAEREKEALRYRAEGDEEASKIRAEADKEVARIDSEARKQAEIIKGKGDGQAMRIYGETFGQDPEFFEFMKSCEALKDIFRNDGTLILSTDSDILQYLDYQQSN
jgi:modulator of FtsH protease HflC